MKLTLGEVAKHVNGEVIGESDTTISGVSEIQNASPGTITFLGNPLYSKYLKDTKADAVFVDKASVLNGKNGIIVSNPQLAMAKTLALFSNKELKDPYIDSKAVLLKNVRIGKAVTIEAGSVIKDGVVIGDKCKIGANTVIGENTTLGKN